jgi:quercetin dioxygenase-like cupin family protein
VAAPRSPSLIPKATRVLVSRRAYLLYDSPRPAVTPMKKSFKSWLVRFGSVAIFALIVCLGISELAIAQEQFGGCLPASERKTEIGCWILASEPVGQLPQHAVFWHLDTFSTLAQAEKAKESRGTVVQALGKIWLLTIAENDWRPKGGERVAQIGPLEVDGDVKYNAQYMEAIMNPGMKTRVHRHPGPEAWYTEGGETCLETPHGKQIGRKGVQVIVPGGQPMRLSVSGTEQRRSLVLVLHDASQPWMIMASDWIPQGLCGK